MGKIKLLSDTMIGKIAAGEVVERPAAAIKELVENSLDAGASAVTVEIREGGLDSIRVTDNGSGIDESDIRMAFERHATSKISKEQDLFSIQTLGFRGEALASIAAVSHVILTTRTKERETGLRVQNEGGNITAVSEIACPVGTTVTVKDLFYNVPVRKGFMKKAGQEASAVGELMTQLLLSRPDVSFRYVSNGKTEYHSPGDGQLASALHTIYGGNALKAMRKVEDHANGLVISGYVGIGDNARGNRNHEYFFINGRVMHSKLLSDAVETACRERVMIGKFPTCALHITIAYEAVDVNVHPNKLEVRFRNENGVYEAVLYAVLQALKDQDAFSRPVEMQLIKNKQIPATVQVQEGMLKEEVTVQQQSVKTPGSVTISDKLPPAAAVKPDSKKPMPEFREISKKSEPAALMQFQDTSQPDLVPYSAERPEAKGTGKEHLPLFHEERAEQINSILPEIKEPIKVFGALFNTFILVEYKDQLLMVDQHAVHERLLFDRLMQEHGKERQPGQELLVPIIVSVTNDELKILEENREALESIGLVMEAFGERDVAVRTIPVILGEAQAKSFVTDVISELETGKDPTFEKKRTALLQTACKHAVKGGESLPEDQLRSLLDEMIEKKVTPTCPHGRPLVVAITHRELDRKFKRIQQ
jgi:DNA mismatch repair protein MutL